MKPVNIHDAKTHLSRLIDRAAKGEEITIARPGKPVAKLVAYRPPMERRVPGAWSGQVWMAADFDEMDDQISELFEGAE
jgi:prevent-host-death family protein